MVLMSISLLGVIAMQVYFFRESYRLKSELFDQSVNESLSAVVTKLQREQALLFIRSKKIDLEQSEGAFSKRGSAALHALPVPLNENKPPFDFRKERERQFKIMLARDQKKADSIYKEIRDGVLRHYANSRLIQKAPLYNASELPSMHVQFNESTEDQAGNVFRKQGSYELMPGGMVLVRGNLNEPEMPALPETTRRDSLETFMVQDSMGDFQTRTFRKFALKSLTLEGEAELRKKMTRAINASTKAIPKKTARELVATVQIQDNRNMLDTLARIMHSTKIPFSRRIKPLDSLLRSEFMNRGIRAAYQTRIDSSADAKKLFITVSDKKVAIPDNYYHASLFPNDFGEYGGGALTVIFPDKNNVILSTMGAMMGTTGALSLVLVFCFGYTLHSIIRQKKISEMKTDFINNMTHEFKTPVATIMIASEGLKDPDVAVDKSRVSRLAGIIYDENVRLANHIERVLNIARIDREDLHLDHVPIDMHELVSAVTDSMSLQLQKRQARLTLDLRADKPVIPGDELHLSNVIYNLVDNAVKYSLGEPQITISSMNTGMFFVIRVADKGIGMTRDQLSKIFGQFYRVPTGNLHDVKGFGLGLSYVNNIVKKLGGTVKVKSEKDKGSEFELVFPVL
jgi:two-component system phosphate regulon sensor histidine kinase PhoR